MLNVGSPAELQSPLLPSQPHLCDCNCLRQCLRRHLRKLLPLHFAAAICCPVPVSIPLLGPCVLGAFTYNGVWGPTSLKLSPLSKRKQCRTVIILLAFYFISIFYVSRHWRRFNHASGLKLPIAGGLWYLIFALVWGSMIMRMVYRWAAVDRAEEESILGEDPTLWPFVNKVEETEAQLIIRAFNNACTETEEHYQTKLEVSEVFTVDNLNFAASFEQVQRELVSPSSNIQSLYHGTSARAAKRIIEEGFKLPEAYAPPGMFGHGIYFAATPLKSWQYSSGYLFVCDVALGSVKKMFSADSSLTLERLRNAINTPSTQYDSIEGATKNEGGSLFNSEWVVYRPEQTCPKLLLKVREHDGDYV